MNVFSAMQNMSASAQSDCAAFRCAEMNTALLLDAMLVASIFISICIIISISISAALLGLSLLILICGNKSTRSMTPAPMTD